MNQKTPLLQEYSDGVCIGISPAPPISASNSGGAPPIPSTSAPPISASNSGGAPPIPSTSASESSIDQERYTYTLHDGVIVGLVFFLLYATMTYLCWDVLHHRDPSFKVEHASVFVDNSSIYNVNTAHWNIGLNVRADGSKEFSFHDLDVLLRCMSNDWSPMAVGSNNRDAKNMTSLNATLISLLPPGLSFEGLSLEFDVMFRVRLFQYSRQAICNNVTVGFSSSATQGFMEAGPRLCHHDSHKFM